MKDYLTKIQSLQNYEIIIIFIICVLIGYFFGNLTSKNK